MKRLLTLIICAVCVCSLRSETAATDSLTSATSTTIADRINASGVASVFQPAALNARLMPKGSAAQPSDADNAAAEKAAATGTGGYRIQLFSGNNARTAQKQAVGRASIIESQFPEYATYVTFDAPYWRLKVGDFRTYEDASAAMARLKSAMPEFAREMRVVRDRIISQ